MPTSCCGKFAVPNEFLSETTDQKTNTAPNLSQSCQLTLSWPGLRIKTQSLTNPAATFWDVTLNQRQTTSSKRDQNESSEKLISQSLIWLCSSLKMKESLTGLLVMTLKNTSDDFAFWETVSTKLHCFSHLCNALIILLEILLKWRAWHLFAEWSSYWETAQSSASCLSDCYCLGSWLTQLASLRDISLEGCAGGLRLSIPSDCL